MRLKKDSIIPWGCVFKITFPNGKIYVGSDTARTARLDFFKYFGSPLKAKTEMLCELGEYLDGEHAYVLKKEILHSEKDVRVGDVLRIEQEFISSHHAKDPEVGYNR
jgi:hypothetical protein